MRLKDILTAVIRGWIISPCGGNEETDVILQELIGVITNEEQF